LSPVPRKPIGAEGNFKSTAYFAAARGLALDPENRQLMIDSKRILKKRFMHYFRLLDIGSSFL
jgi:hypothetical protein